MSEEVRRRAAENAFQRAEQAGHAIEQDQRFRAWIEEWIAGQMTMPELAMRYRTLVIERSGARRADNTTRVFEALQQTQTMSGTEPEQCLDLETAIGRLMAEDHR